uniref:Uncharacterized protein n=1 Tax=Oryza rufipogon TaxID=4529 RepID=A0A0E0QK85_ORYRU
MARPAGLSPAATQRHWVHHNTPKLLRPFVLSEPGPSVDGPPMNAIILAPDPGTQTPNRLAATLNAVPVHLDAR